MVKNPLRKRFLRDLRDDIGKYLVIFFIMALTIAEISGFLVCDESMIAAYEESFTKYNIEDGNFTVDKRLSERQTEAIRDLGVSLYELFYADTLLTDGQTLRIFQKRNAVNTECLMDGRFPENADEIAIDRMFADNNGFACGDSIEQADGTKRTITGLVALSDYSAQFESNNDMMFDAKNFGVSIVPEAAFSDIPTDEKTLRYAFTYNEKPDGETEEKEMSDAFRSGLSHIVSLRSYVPRFSNKAIQFTGEDMGGDRQLVMFLLYIMTAIMAFVFAVTTVSTIQKESAAIGTLRATGYTRGEMLRHYLTMPFLVTMAGAVTGNVLGYTVMKDVNAGLYYGSYSLPTYVTRWSGNAFLITTVLPVVLMLAINVWILSRKLRMTPLQFLRREGGKGRKKHAVKLPEKMPFFARFRLRVLFQNIGNYVVMVAGILFAYILLLFGLALPSVLTDYEKSVPDSMLSTYQYVLQLPAGAEDEESKLMSAAQMLLFAKAVETENPDAEKFSAYTLRTLPDTRYMEEDIMLYGIGENSRYVPFAGKDGEIYVSETMVSKYGLAVGGEITLTEPYEDKTYTFTVSGVYPYAHAPCLFMTQKTLNETFDLGEDTFVGYFSDTEITDIDSKYIGQVIDEESLTKISRQLMISFGGMMKVVDGFAVIIFMLLIYLLSKTIIEKNAQSISMTKILGYEDREIASLYITVTTIFVMCMLVLMLPLTTVILKVLFAYFVSRRMTGWIPFAANTGVYVKMIVLGVVTYLLVAALELRKIKKIPMDEALKNVE